MNKSKINPIAPLISGIVDIRNWFYDKEYIKPTRLKIPVISVGNLTMGGTGKTPFIQWLIYELELMGYRPGVVSRNYRGSSKVSEWVHTAPASYLEFGDEAVLLKLKNPTIPILSGPKKWASALKMEKETNEVNVILIDDGFQHRRLHRDLEIVLLDTSVTPSDYNWPPFGRARESFKSLNRSDVIIFTRWEQRNEKTMEVLKLTSSIRKIELQAEQSSDTIQWILGKPILNSEIFKKGIGLAFCGLGNPNSFLKTTELQGLKIGEFLKFEDHTSYDSSKIKRLIEAGRKFDYLVTSEKDMVKLQEWPFQGPSLCVIPMKLKVNGTLEAFREKLARSLWTNS